MITSSIGSKRRLYGRVPIALAVAGFCLAVCTYLLLPASHAVGATSPPTTNSEDESDAQRLAPLIALEFGKPILYDQKSGLIVGVKLAQDGSVKKLIVAVDKSGAVFEYEPHGRQAASMAMYEDSKPLAELGHTAWYDYNGDGVFDLRLCTRPNVLLGAPLGPEILIERTWKSGKLTDNGPGTPFVVGSKKYTGIIVGSARYIFDSQTGTWKVASSLRER